jgi:hypothetical protein
MECIKCGTIHNLINFHHNTSGIFLCRDCYLDSENIIFNENDNLLNKIKEITFSNSLGDEFSLSRLSETTSNKKYKEVIIPDLSLFTGEMLKSTIKTTGEIKSLNEIVQRAPNGLFTATVNPSTLSKFTNGTISTMVKGSSGQIIEHAGFTEIGLNTFINPSAIVSSGLQAISTVSGVYYLHKINEQITDMTDRLETLIKYHHDESIGRLLSAKKELIEITRREFFDSVDLSIIRSHKKTANEIHQEYFYRLNKDYTKKYKYSELEYEVSIAFEADKIALFAELIEIAIRIQTGMQTPIVNELTKQLKLNYHNSFYHNYTSKIESLYSNITEKYTTISENKRLQRSDVIRKLSSNSSKSDILMILGELVYRDQSYRKANKMAQKFEKEPMKINNELKNKKDADRISNIIDEFIDSECSKTEILYIPMEDNKHRLFVEVIGA